MREFVSSEIHRNGVELLSVRPLEGKMVTERRLSGDKIAEIARSLVVVVQLRVTIIEVIQSPVRSHRVHARRCYVKKITLRLPLIAV